MAVAATAIPYSGAKAADDFGHASATTRVNLPTSAHDAGAHRRGSTPRAHEHPCRSGSAPTPPAAARHHDAAAGNHAAAGSPAILRSRDGQRPSLQWFKNGPLITGAPSPRHFANPQVPTRRLQLRREPLHWQPSPARRRACSSSRRGSHRSLARPTSPRLRMTRPLPDLYQAPAVGTRPPARLQRPARSSTPST